MGPKKRFSSQKNRPVPDFTRKSIQIRQKTE